MPETQLWPDTQSASVVHGQATMGQQLESVPVVTPPVHVVTGQVVPSCTAQFEGHW